MTLGGTTPFDCHLFLDNKPLLWGTSVKYLGDHMLAGRALKVDMTVAKRKYYGCFNSILSVCGKHTRRMATANKTCVSGKN